MEDLQVHEDNMADNLELTQGLIFSQRVLIALIEKGLTRKKAYELVQRNAMKAWKERTGFLKLLKKDNDVSKVISKAELESVFDYSVFFKHVDTIYKRLKLNKPTKNKVVRNKVLGPQTL
jgi:adenylosuccinate lyase